MDCSHSSPAPRHWVRMPAFVLPCLLCVLSVAAACLCLCVCSGGVMDGKLMGYLEVKKLQSMPTKLELIATIARLINQVLSPLMSPTPAALHCDSTARLFVRQRSSARSSVQAVLPGRASTHRPLLTGAPLAACPHTRCRLRCRLRWPAASTRSPPSWPTG